MKRIESIKLEVGKVISELTQKYLNQGLVLTRFETGGINGFTKVMVFSSLDSSEQQVIFARESNVECYLKVQKVATHTVYTATMTEEETGTGFIDTMFEGAEKEVVTEFVLMKHRGKQFLVTKEELDGMVATMEARQAQSYKRGQSHRFTVSKLKTVSGFKRQGAVITRMGGSKLAYEIVGLEKGSKRVELATK